MRHPQANSAFHSHDVLVIGSGAAGLSLALRLAEDLLVAVLSRSARAVAMAERTPKTRAS